MAPLDFLSKVNSLLEQVPLKATEFFRHTFKSGEKYTQDFVDSCCIWIAWKINIMVERLRQKVIKQLADHYKGAVALANSMNIVAKAVSDPLGTIGGVFSFFAKPVKTVANFVKVLAVEIPRLAANLANIMNSLPPEPPDPHINFNAFRLRIGTISLAEIMKAETMPSPEEMFPAPPSPFSKNSFDKSFENAKPKENKIMYKLNSDNTSIIQQAIEEEMLNDGSSLSMEDTINILKNHLD